MLEKTREFIKALEKDNTGAEAVVLYQNGEIALEHRFVVKNERPIYSHTKSFVSTLAGIAIDEGKLRLDDKIIDIFPEYESVITDERVKNLTLEHFLKMSSGFGSGFIMSERRRNGEGFPDYMAYLLSKPLKNNPGEKFVYSNGDSHMVACMIQRVVQKPLAQYAYEKLLSPLEIGFPGWESDPMGTPFGGSGMYMSISNMMKLGILYLNQGKWNGQQIVSEEWIKNATVAHISTDYGGDWSGSYGYQFWIIEGRKGAYRADGAYGQYSIVIPDENAVIATQCSENNDVGRFSQMIREYIIDK